MLLVKLHLLATVAAVMYAALFIDKRLPYWPIEISRMAASGPAALSVFRAGVTLLLVTIIYGEGSHLATWLWVALMQIAWLDDVTSFAGHMAGVVQLGLTCAVQAYAVGQPALWPFCAAAVIFVSRLWLKAYACVCEDMADRRYQLSQFDSVAKVVAYVQHLMHIGKDIMMGAREAKTTTGRVAFRFGGVGQWLVFVLLGSVF